MSLSFRGYFHGKDKGSVKPYAPYVWSVNYKHLVLYACNYFSVKWSGCCTYTAFSRITDFIVAFGHYVLFSSVGAKHTAQRK